MLIDVDLHTGGTYEEWTITALDAAGAPIGDPVVITAPSGPDNPECLNPPSGPGDALAVGWEFSFPTSQIYGVRLHYTGAFGEGPVAFDNFSPADVFPLPSVSVTSSSCGKTCSGESVELTANVVDGHPPFRYQWQQETSPGIWGNLGTLSTQTVSPSTTTRYQVIVTDADPAHDPATSDPFELPVCGPNPDMNGDGVLDAQDIQLFVDAMLEQ